MMLRCVRGQKIYADIVIRCEKETGNLLIERSQIGSKLENCLVDLGVSPPSLNLIFFIDFDRFLDFYLHPSSIVSL